MNFKLILIGLLLVLFSTQLYADTTPPVTTFEPNVVNELNSLYAGVNYSLLGEEYVATIDDSVVCLNGVQNWLGGIIFEKQVTCKQKILIHSHPTFFCEPSSKDYKAKELLNAKEYYIQCGINMFRRY